MTDVGVKENAPPSAAHSFGPIPPHAAAKPRRKTLSAGGSKRSHGQGLTLAPFSAQP